MPSTPSTGHKHLLFLLSLPVILSAVLTSWLWLPANDLLAPYAELWSPTPSDAPHVKIAQGLVIGTVLNDSFPAPIEAFLGLPYAQPPVDDLRFRRALPLQPSEAVIKARKYGAVCPGKQEGKKLKSSEDCLTVNIFRPKPVKDGPKLPVAVYVHGGGYNRMSSQVHNTASMVAWSEKPFIGASFNYRIGALGFLPSFVTQEQGLLNLGLHDQILLLQWIQENIEEFGGDKNDVTIFGLSAGAHSIGHHILNYQEGAKPLFHKAILESGAPTSRAIHPYNAKLHEDQFEMFINNAGCFGQPKYEIMPCLRYQSKGNINKAMDLVFDKYKDSLRWAFQPVIDDEIIHGQPVDVWTSGKWNRVPILTGYAANEGTDYIPRKMSSNEDFTAFWKTLVPHYPARDLRTIMRLYPDPQDPESPYLETRNMKALNIAPHFKRAEAAYAHYAYICPVHHTATTVSSAANAPPIWVYEWALNSTVKGGANHGDNMHYESFQYAITSISEAQREVSGVYHAYITSFITGGDPNSIGGRFEGRTKWEQYAKGDEKVMVFGEGNDERAGGVGKGIAAHMVDTDPASECQIWWKKMNHYEYKKE